jgi:beta-glucanase (GH16 family)
MTQRLALGLSLLAASVAGAPSAAARAGGQPATVFVDDFAGPSLDRSKWAVIVTGRTVNNEQQAYVDSPDTIEFLPDAQAEAAGAERGALVLHARFSEGLKTPEGRAFDFISGRLEGRGRFEFTYGTVAARIKLTAGPGLWPAFWALGTGRWPDTGEMDVMENVGEPAWTSVALHGPGYSGNTPLVRRYPFPNGQNITGWHVYAMDWQPDALVFRVDDVEIYRVTKAMVEQHGRWAYDTPKFLILNVAIGGNYPQAVNHAQTPYPGVPAETVELIKSGAATMMVDWVRVTNPQERATQ